MTDQLRSLWLDYIRDLQQDPTYEIRKAQFLAQKNERYAVESEPLNVEIRSNLISLILTDEGENHV